MVLSGVSCIGKRMNVIDSWKGQEIVDYSENNIMWTYTVRSTIATEIHPGSSRLSRLRS